MAMFLIQQALVEEWGHMQVCRMREISSNVISTVN